MRTIVENGRSNIISSIIVFMMDMHFLH
jgi:hypothetical protein